MPTTEADGLRSGLVISTISIVWTVAASVVSVVSGIASSDLVLVAFGGTGLLDAAGSVALVIHFRHALRHETFSEGHERVAFLIVNTGLVVVSGSTAVEAIMRLTSHDVGGSSVIGTATAAVSVAVLGLLARRKVALGRSIPSHALFSDGILSTTGAALAVITVSGLRSPASGCGGPTRRPR